MNSGHESLTEDESKMKRKTRVRSSKERGRHQRPEAFSDRVEESASDDADETNPEPRSAPSRP